MPFEQLVEALQPERHLSHTPLFQVMFSWQDAARDEIAITGLTLTPIDPQHVAAKFDLTLGMGESPSGLAGSLDKTRTSSTPTRSCAWPAHFRSLLSALVEDPDVIVERVPLLTATSGTRW